MVVVAGILLSLASLSSGIEAQASNQSIEIIGVGPPPVWMAIRTRKRHDHRDDHSDQSGDQRKRRDDGRGG